MPEYCHPELQSRIIVAAALIKADRRVLVQQRRLDRELGGLWEFPGGKVEAGETPEAALVRELYEELGIIVRIEDVIPGCFASAQVGDRHMILLLYLCRNWVGEPVALDADALQWLEPLAMMKLAMPPADVPLIPILDALI
jgi:8-oxo-dGTP diphosphatase